MKIVYLLVAIILLGLWTPMVFSSSANWQGADIGLGQPWPHSPDVSRAADWHVYRFYKDGVQYIQVNDARGLMHAVIAFKGKLFWVLPMGVDSQHVWMEPSTRSLLAPSIPGELLYDDGGIQITRDLSEDGKYNLYIVGAGLANEEDALCQDLGLNAAYGTDGVGDYFFWCSNDDGSITAVPEQCPGDYPHLTTYDGIDVCEATKDS